MDSPISQLPPIAAIGPNDMIPIVQAGVTSKATGDQLLTLGSAMQVADYAAVRSYTGTRTNIFVTGYMVALAPSGIAGMFTLDSTDAATADNGGTVLVTVGGKRYKRIYSGPADVRWFGVVGGGTDERSKVQTALNAVKHLNIPSGLVVGIDNSAADGLTMTNANTILTGGGTLSFLSIGFNGLKVTGIGCTLEDVTMKGPGVYDTSGAGGAVIPGLVYLDGTGLGAPINCRMENLKVLEPGKMGIVAYKAVGFEILNCRVESSLAPATWLNTSNNHLIRCYSCARFKIAGNRLKGFSEGIVIQAYDSGTYVFDDYTGTVSNKSRKFQVVDNQVVGTYDHAVYICNENEHYVCNDNFLWMASDAEGGEGTCSLKLEGGYFEACGNYSREGIQMRNPYNGRVENNVVSIYSAKGTTHNPNKMGILAQDTIYQRPLNGMTINNNTVIAVGAIDTDAAIWMEGAVYGGYQSVISDLSVCNNTLIGFGQNSNGGNSFAIVIHQDMPLAVGVVSGSTGSGVTVTGNTIDMSTFTAFTGGTGSSGIELLNIDNATVDNNTVRNFTQRGLNLLGVRYSMIDGNNFIGNAAGASQRFATLEDASNTAVHVDSVQNVYGTNNGKNVDYKYFIADETSICRDQNPLINAGAAGVNQTLSAYDECELFIWAPTVAGLTLTFATGRPWKKGQKVKVFNHGSQSFTVTATGTAIAAGNALSFCCTGANTFVAYV